MLTNTIHDFHKSLLKLDLLVTISGLYERVRLHSASYNPPNNGGSMSFVKFADLYVKAAQIESKRDERHTSQSPCAETMTVHEASDLSY